MCVWGCLVPNSVTVIDAAKNVGPWVYLSAKDHLNQEL